MYCFVGASQFRRYPADGRAAEEGFGDSLLLGLFFDCLAAGMMNTLVLGLEIENEK
jgi:hypothetical protein